MYIYFLYYKMRKLLTVIFIVLIFDYTTHSYSHSDSFDEELFLKPLPSGHVYAYFQFTTLWETQNNPETLQHSRLFPRGLSEIISRHNVNELHVTLTQGLWKYKDWGYPFYDSSPGAEITAWFNERVKDVDKEWKGLTNALAGLLCASLNFVDTTNTLSPEFSLRPTGAIQKSPNSTYLRYSSLPRETVCTENLTPFKKLLPCDSKRGLATLLISVPIHNTNYHSLGIHFRTVCRNPECTRLSLELRQSVSLIYDVLLHEVQTWTLPRFFGSGLNGACPLATLSNIYVDVSSNNTVHTYDLTPTPTMETTSYRGGQKNKIAVYDVRTHAKDGMFTIACSYEKKTMESVSYPSILYANRYVIGYGQERGSLVTKLYNNYWKPLDIVLLENIPWYLPMYLHTMKVTNNDKEIHPIVKRYVPARDREKPHYLELILRLPARSITKFSVEIDYSFLKWQEYPPDANHGFYIGPVIITASLPIARNYTALPIDGSTITSVFNASRQGYIVELRTEILLISLPTPDFSMPYNVLCLTCTGVAIVFGPLSNITSKRLVLKPQSPNLISKVLSLIKSILCKQKEQKEKAE